MPHRRPSPAPQRLSFPRFPSLAPLRPTPPCTSVSWTSGRSGPAGSRLTPIPGVRASTRQSLSDGHFPPRGGGRGSDWPLSKSGWPNALDPPPPSVGIGPKRRTVLTWHHRRRFFLLILNIATLSTVEVGSDPIPTGGGMKVTGRSKVTEKWKVDPPPIPKQLSDQQPTDSQTTAH